ncbi:restriction endonuclease [Cupriavidus sp. CV2]|uniref:restriction endonuclease n=1 Tax=Cupriavidus ulmosensis TaxID=3065913 RepID=UPI00296AC0EE|nr:restriction endonuclease [Cupriavidus sp. CV2]MDW3683335.1 restriction endonuclease [Cupriavidus sp. CV2]
MNTDADWLKLEKLVAEIQAKLAPNAEVLHNTKLPGKDTEVDRQIDVLLKQKIGQYEMLIVIDCKDYKTPVDVKGIEEFHGLVRDVRAHKGVLVCPSGFTQTAKKLAKRLEMDLLRPVDTGNHKWRVSASVPAICDVRTCQMAFGFQTSAPYPLTIREHPTYMDVFTDSALALEQPLGVAAAAWNDGRLPYAPVEHRDLDLYDAETYVDNGHGMLVPASFAVSLLVEQRLYYGHLPLEAISGFLDEHTGMVITNAFTTGILNWETVRSNWQPLKDGDKPPLQPIFYFGGLECVGVQ